MHIVYLSVIGFIELRVILMHVKHLIYRLLSKKEKNIQLTDIIHVNLLDCVSVYCQQISLHMLEY